MTNWCNVGKILKIILDLIQHIGEDDETGVDQVEYQPHLHWLDGGGRRQTSGYIEIYRGQHHHTGSTKIRVKYKGFTTVLQRTC